MEKLLRKPNYHPVCSQDSCKLLFCIKLYNLLAKVKILVTTKEMFLFYNFRTDSLPITYRTVPSISAYWCAGHIFGNSFKSSEQFLSLVINCFTYSRDRKLVGECACNQNNSASVPPAVLLVTPHSTHS